MSDRPVNLMMGTGTLDLAQRRIGELEDECDQLREALRSIRHYLTTEGRPLVDRIIERIDQAGVRDATD